MTDRELRLYTTQSYKSDEGPLVFSMISVCHDQGRTEQFLTSSLGELQYQAPNPSPIGSCGFQNSKLAAGGAGAQHPARNDTSRRSFITRFCYVILPFRPSPAPVILADILAIISFWNARRLGSKTARVDGSTS